MSDIVLSSAVRQNLLSLQATADMLSTTQNRLSTGKKVNSALDNPTNYFTASSLDSRASDINNLLDGIGNGVQILQAANTGITSLQKLVDSAKSVANQALQTTVGYSSKSSVTATIAGATADDLRGTTSNNTVAGSVVNNNLSSPAAVTAATKLVVASNSDTLATAITDGSQLTVNGKTITFTSAQTTKSVDGNGNWTIGIGAGSTLAISDVLGAIDTITGASTASTVSSGKLTLSTGTTSDLSISGSGNALAALGLTAGTTARTPGAMNGLTLTIGATGVGGVASSIVFGDGTNGTVKSLNDLNKALATNNLQASLDSSGNLTISTTNDAASATIGTIGGTAAATGKAFNGLSASAPVADAAAQLTRDNLVNQYNTIIDQIRTTAQDSSFNGVNLLNGDTLKLVFNETGKSTLSITGVTFDPAGLGLSSLTSGAFKDNQATNSVLSSLNSASSTLRSQASAFGSNLSVVQIRQDFNKNLINVLQTGSSNLTLADANEEAANSQALSTRQSIAVSALSLANTSQQSVLQLLR